MQDSAAVPAVLGRALGRRAAIASVIGVPTLAVIAHACASQRPSDVSIQFAVHFGMPSFMLALLAVVCPHEIARPSLPYVVSGFGVFAVLTARGALLNWHETSGLSFAERSLRVSGFLACTAINAGIAVSAWRSGGARMWRDFRLGAFSFYSLRAAANVLLRGCCAPATYPPGHQDFASACACCVWGALLVVCATPSVRQWLVETAGFTTVTVRLNDLAKSQVTLRDLAATPAAPDAGPSAPSTRGGDSDGRVLPPPDRYEPASNLASGPLHGLMLVGRTRAPPLNHSYPRSPTSHYQAPHLMPHALVHRGQHLRCCRQAIFGREGGRWNVAPPPLHVSGGVTNDGYLGFVAAMQRQRWLERQGQMLNLDAERAVDGLRAPRRRVKSIAGSSESSM